MSKSKTVIPSSQICDADQVEYEALEAALLQTKRGRDFLTEYLRRNGADAISPQTIMIDEELTSPRAASQSGMDTDKILRAVEKLHVAVMEQHENSNADHVRMNVLEMANAIATTRSEIAAMRITGDNDHLLEAAGEMDAIVRSTEKATNDILHAAEKIQEVAWRLREAGTDGFSCEEIDNSATEIYMACSFQDITGQRTTKVVRVLQYLEERINSMIKIWGIKSDGAAVPTTKNADNMDLTDQRPDAHLLNGPQDDNAALGQDNIDELLGGASIDRMADEDQSVVACENTLEEVLDEPFLIGEAAEDLNNTSSDEIIDEEKLKALFS